jgi:hypothetical protein
LQREVLELKAKEQDGVIAYFEELMGVMQREPSMDLGSRG